MKIGTIGSGSIVDTFLNALRLVQDAKCIAVYSRYAEKAKTFAEKHNVVKHFSDLEAFFADPEIDTIYIAAPNSYHFMYCKMALESGKNVICEKPFTSTAVELSSLITLAGEKNLFLFEAITTIHMPNFQLIRENLALIGDVKFVQCNYSQYSSKYNSLLAGELPNIFNTEFSGGALMDINIYNIHFIMGLFGKPTIADYYPNLHPNGIDTSGLLVMKYADFVCSAVGCKDSRSMNFAIIQGTRGYINVVNGANGCEQFTIYTDTENLTINAQTTQQKLSYEITNFNKIIKEKDFKSCNELLSHSLSVLEMITASRKKAGLYFSADKINN